MATCKDCVHYDVCEFHLDEKTTMTVNECMHFKDKSKFVELPCKVGDTVYEIDGGNSESGDIYSSVVRRVIFDTAGIAFDERAIGKAIFLTREEAEKALKEREQK
jgi:hypothetical protein